MMAVSASMMTAEHGCICCCAAENGCCALYRLQLHEWRTHAAIACRAVRGVTLLSIEIAGCLSGAALRMHRWWQSTLSAELLHCRIVAISHLLHSKHTTTQAKVFATTCTGGALYIQLSGRLEVRSLLIHEGRLLTFCSLWLFTVLLSICKS